METASVCCAHVSVAKPIYFHGYLPVRIKLPVQDVDSQCKKVLTLKRVHFIKITSDFPDIET